eukprot:6213359-Pleurochrysis_carterae.AAC.1
MEWPRKHTNLRIKEEEELVLRQMISGIIPKWRETDHIKERKGTIMAMRLWTGAMMNGARVQMKMWTKKRTHTKTMYNVDGITEGERKECSRNGKTTGHDNQEQKGERKKGKRKDKRKYMG